MIQAVIVRPLATAAVGLGLLIGAGPIATVSFPASAQDADPVALARELERLRRDVDVLQRQLARGGIPAASAAATSSAAPPGEISHSFIEQSYARFSDMETQLRDLTGRVEELNFKVTRLSERLDKLVGDVDFRLSALERGAPATGGPASAAGTPGAPSASPGPSAPPAPTGPTASLPGPPPASSAPTGSTTASSARVAPGEARMVLVPGPRGQPAAAGAESASPTTPPEPAPAAPGATQTAAVTLPQGSPEAQYEFAYAQLLQAQREQGDFSRAEAALRAFIDAHPSHRLAGNAQYWLGETHYVRRDYANAAAAFAEGFRKYPNSDKAPDNLLKLGMSLGHLNRNSDACGTLSELERRYPQASVSIKQATQREKLRLRCG